MGKMPFPQATALLRGLLVLTLAAAEALRKTRMC